MIFASTLLVIGILLFLLKATDMIGVLAAVSFLDEKTNRFPMTLHGGES